MVMTFIRKSLRRLLHSIGYDFHRLDLSTRPDYQLYKGLQKFSVNLVFDIGGNVGQFVSELRRVGYKNQVVSFEPLLDAYQILTKNALNDKSWKVHDRCAIGSYDGEIEINRSSNSVSSSILPMLKSHTEVAKDSKYVGTERVPISKLDTVAPQYITSSSRFFIKIDTQGYEWEVLDGASETIKKAQGVICEMSLVPLYDGQKLWKEMINRFENLGFTLWAIQRGFTDQVNGRTLQVNVIFFRVDNTE